MPDPSDTPIEEITEDLPDEEQELIRKRLEEEAKRLEEKLATLENTEK